MHPVERIELMNPSRGMDSCFRRPAGTRQRKLLALIRSRHDAHRGTPGSITITHPLLSKKQFHPRKFGGGRTRGIVVVEYIWWKDGASLF
jgi:hypothetical protein